MQFKNELGNDITVSGGTTDECPNGVYFKMEGPHSLTESIMTVKEAEAVIAVLIMAIANREKTTVKKKWFRLRSAAVCVYYGVMPWWTYEKECHYGDTSLKGYAKHAWHNLVQASKWLIGKPEFGDYRFELTVNAYWHS